MTFVGFRLKNNNLFKKQSFESLKNEVDDYVKKILKDQQHNAMTLNKKNDLRDNLRRKLNELVKLIQLNFE